MFTCFELEHSVPINIHGKVIRTLTYYKEGDIGVCGIEQLRYRGVL